MDGIFSQRCAEGWTLRLFLPRRLLMEHSGPLIGWFDIDDNFVTVFVFGVGFEVTKRSWDPLLPDEVGTVGTLIWEADGTRRSKLKEPRWSRDRQCPYVCLAKTVDRRLKVTEARVGNERLSPPRDCLLVLYDPQNYTAIDSRIIGNGSAKDILAVLRCALVEFERLPVMVQRQVAPELGQTYSDMRETFSWRMLKVVIRVTKVSCVVLNVRPCAWFFEKISRFSHVGSQMKTRVLQLEYLGNGEAKANCNLRYWNTLAAVSFDMIVGLILIALWHRTNSTVLLVDFFLEWTNHLMVHLRSLLQWLMGVPAGFKLNSPLSSAMGTFFSYHIYLWEAYLYVIKPILEMMLDVGSYFGILGITFQMCLLKDLLALATFHVYCFYAYAARIYNINFIGLVSYWRLFRGKKWNPLRKRVDSCTYDADQLFMGTLCFTTLFFLLPTTLLYYTVFTVLRIPILLLQGLIHRMVVLIDCLPLYTLILRLLHSKLLVDGVHFDVTSRRNTSNSVLILLMRETCCSWLTAATSFCPRMSNNACSLSWKTFAKNILMGKLVYPI